MSKTGRDSAHQADPLEHATPDTVVPTPVLPGLNPQTPSTMPRAEDDEATRAGSPDFNDRPGSGKYTDDRLKHF